MNNKSVSIISETLSGLPVAIRFRRGNRYRTFKKFTLASYVRVQRLLTKRAADMPKRCACGRVLEFWYPNCLQCGAVNPAYR
jgi:hypothetical protein